MLIKFAVVVLSVWVNVAFAAESGVSINAGYTGHWVDSQHPGQGLIIEVLPTRRQIALGWFSFANGAPGTGTVQAQRWFSGFGPYGGVTANLTLYDSNGGVFAGPRAVSTEPIGDASFNVLSCTSAIFSYHFNNGTSGVLNLTRLTPFDLCSTLSGGETLPVLSNLRAEAASEFDDGMSVTCGLDFIMELNIQSDDGYTRRYSGTLGGEAYREVVDSTGAGTAFFADAFGPIDVRITGNRIDIQYTLELPERLPKDEDSRFWIYLNSFAGDIDSDGNISGSWRCAPLDTRDDESLFTTGQWRLEPIVSGSPNTN